ncbi:alpha/beta fold hydrolase [Acidovorax sp.]|uniref:alpha/beta fold hydrolase n=1 Tax=Acidovorax sp. TaxID=1872122 RepID=UPI00391F7EA8
MPASLAFSPARPPSYALLVAEPVRAALEFAAYQVMSEQALPRGDRHAVVIFPGLATNGVVTRPLQSFCERLGYDCFDWGMGLNVGPQGDVQEWLAALAQRILNLTESHADPISLVGWSLGGIYAREVAKRVPTRVRQVVTIGTPFAGTAEHTNVGSLYRMLNGGVPPTDPDLCALLSAAPPVPTTSIYSRSDGVVAWQACVDRGHDNRRRVENIEVEGSHCGMPWNPAVLRVLADRLAQRPGTWRAYAGQTLTTASPGTWAVA